MIIPKPKYIENILEITKSGKGFICCDVVCECGARHFIRYKNVIVRSTEEAAYEAAYNAFNEKYSRIRFGDENGISYLYAMKGLFAEEIIEKFEYKQLDSTEIVKVKCAKCGKEYVLFDSHFHGYDATIPKENVNTTAWYMTLPLLFGKKIGTVLLHLPLKL